ncbi:uncharacterized protein [Chelonus insularis]|uniref:uncharacterized protein n=1 Tax=Chelonus insularis TaxID=460826 RepID=UPI0015886F96|nr:uncharacterized protein LOC118069549 [Chelonus insularis]
MAMPTVSRFCFCASLKTATTFGGIFYSFLDKGISCLIHHTHAWTTNDESSTFLIFIYVTMSISFITTLLLIFGSTMERHKWMQPFLAFNIIDFHITTLTIWYGTYKLFKDSTDIGCMALILGNLAIAFSAYYYIVVYSRYLEIYREPDDALIDNPDD